MKLLSLGMKLGGKTRAENSYLGIITVCGSSLGPENRENGECELKESRLDAA